MVIGDLLCKAAKTLDANGTGDSYNEALVLLTIALNCSKTYIYVNKDKTITEDEEIKYLGYVERRAKGEPVAYIAERAWFMSFEFIVSPAVLIPRPETEGLVEKATGLIYDEFNGCASVLDLCSGSGCVGISVANILENVTVLLSDVDDGAVEIARENIKKHNRKDRVSLIKSDMFENLGNNSYDLILSNPPYVAKGDIIHLEEEVARFEPSIALYGGSDGLYFYRKIAREAGHYMNKGGYLILEAGINQAESISDILVQNKFKLLDIQKDIGGIPRIITAKKQ